MIATTALLAFLASIVSAHQLQVLPNATSRDGAVAACAQLGGHLAGINTATLDSASALLPAGVSGWIASWNGDAYGGACLQLKAGTITAAASCLEQHLPVCEGVHVPHPEPCPSSSTSIPCESSSSSTSCESSSTSCESSSSTSCESSSTSCESSSTSCPSSTSSGCGFSSDSTWGCESSTFDCDVSSSISCSDSVSSDICSSSSSSSSKGRCDPCCAGVRKLTYQAPFGAGIYLGKVTQRFTVFDAFGPNACSNVAQLAAVLGVNATLIGSNGTNFCDFNDPTPYGTYYVVSRAWALNQPIYALWNGTVYAANSLFNCYGEYRAIMINKPLSELAYVTNSHGEVCFERCRGKPRSCVALCQADFARPAYFTKFEMGK